jgi:hypothetical protein
MINQDFNFDYESWKLTILDKVVQLPYHVIRKPIQTMKWLPKSYGVKEQSRNTLEIPCARDEIEF